MRQETPQVEFPHIESSGPFAAVAHLQNGLATIEAWRLGNVAQGHQAVEEGLVRDQQRLQQARDRVSQQHTIQWLRLGTLAEDPVVAANSQRQLDEALVEYHQGRALTLASRVVELTVEPPRFAGVRAKFAEMRQAYHGSMARRAASRLIKLA